MNEIVRKPVFSVTTGALPASRKIHLAGERHPFLRVPMREIDLHPTASEPPFRVYDSSGPYTDPSQRIDIHAGLAPSRAPWIRAASWMRADQNK